MGKGGEDERKKQKQKKIEGERSMIQHCLTHCLLDAKVTRVACAAAARPRETLVSEGSGIWARQLHGLT